MRRLLDHPLVVVLGKGGVGRTSVSAALGLAAAQQGKRACVAELGDVASLPVRFGLSGRSFAFRHGAPGVDIWSLTVPEALEEFGARKLGLPSFARKVVRNRFVSTFVDAVPGLHDLLLLGKIENMIREPRPGDPVYDVLIIDAPATGHGITLLSAARTMTEVTRAGPFFEMAKGIDVFLADTEQTATALVTLPESLPVSETLELADQLQASGFEPHSVIVNRVEPALLPDEPPRLQVEAVLAELEHGRALQDLARQSWDRLDGQDAALQWLHRELVARGHAPPIRAPWAPTAVEHALGDALAAVL